MSLLGHLLPLAPYPYRGVRGDCPVCGSPDHAPIARIDRRWKRLTTELCGACGLFFTDPMPTEAELAAYYARAYRLDYQGVLGRPPKRQARAKAREAEMRRAVIERRLAPAPGARMLDIGCGAGDLVAALAAAGYDAHGLEPGEGFARAGAERLPGRIRQGGWAEAAGAWDVVVCLHVLEHLPRPMAALAAMRRLLAPGGALYLEVPNMQHYEPKGTERFHFAHVLGFSGDTLKHAAARAGFRLLAEEQPTSLLLVDAADPRGREMPVDLAATAAANRRDYGARLGPAGYLAYQAGRLARLARRRRA